MPRTINSGSATANNNRRTNRFIISPAFGSPAFDKFERLRPSFQRLRLSALDFGGPRFLFARAADRAAKYSLAATRLRIYSVTAADAVLLSSPGGVSGKAGEQT